MSQHKYVVHLNPQQRNFLLHLTRSEIRPPHQKMHAQVLLQTDRNQSGEKPPTDEQVARSFNINSRTVLRIKVRFLQEGLMRALHSPSPEERPARRKLSAEQEAQLVALASCPPPVGKKRWSLQLLADQMVLLHLVESISKETVRQVLKRRHASFPETSLSKPPSHRKMHPAQESNLLQSFFHLCDSLRPVVATNNLSKLLAFTHSDTLSLPISRVGL